MAIPAEAELTSPDDNLGRRGDAYHYGARLELPGVTDWFGALITRVARTLVDQARHSRRDGIMAVDAALREELVTRSQIDASLAGAVGWPGVRQARTVLALGDGRAESALESITRLALIDDGFPPVEPQVLIGPYRVDLLFKEQRLIVECDGLDKYGVFESWGGEKQREHWLRRQRYKVERVTWEDVVRYWVQTSARLRAALRAPLPG